jgi:hypothetical protein
LQVVDSQAGIALRNYTVRVLDSGPMRPLFAATSGSFVIRERSVFLLDASGSMSGAKVAALRAEMTTAVNALPPHYKLDLLSYGDQFGVAQNYNTKLWGSVLPATPANKITAVNWVNGPALNPGGGTPTYNAMKDACQTYSPGLKGYFLVTDGYPNTGGSASQILSDVPAWWGLFDECHFYGGDIGGGAASFMQALAGLLQGDYIAM